LNPVDERNWTCPESIFLTTMRRNNQNLSANGCFKPIARKPIGHGQSQKNQYPEKAGTNKNPG